MMNDSVFARGAISHNPSLLLRQKWAKIKEKIENNRTMIEKKNRKILLNTK